MTDAAPAHGIAWGQLFELAAKRGVLAGLLRAQLVSPGDAQLHHYRSTTLGHVSDALLDALALTDPVATQNAKSFARHVLVLGYGLGESTIRKYIAELASQGYTKPVLRGLWCPCQLPGERSREEASADVDAFAAAFKVEPATEVLGYRGQPARADFLLWLRGDVRRDFLLCLEFSFNSPFELDDLTDEQPHLEELERHIRLVNSRGVFSRICAEVDGERFALSDRLSAHFAAFAARDKPLYKLCQGASYVERCVALLHSQGTLGPSCRARVIALTSNGLEGLAAHFIHGEAREPRATLMTQLGGAYRSASRLDEESGEQGLAEEIRMAFNQILLSLPPLLREQVRTLQHLPPPGTAFSFTLTEDVPSFKNPRDKVDVDAALRAAANDEALEVHLGKDALPRIREQLEARVGEAPTLRDLHAAAVVAGLRAARKGRLNVLALEGNPGIGKTTAVMQYLSRALSEGFLFVYLSPRVVINKDVTAKMSRNDGRYSEVLTLTSSFDLISTAREWYRQQVKSGTAPERNVDSAVVVDGFDVRELSTPDGPTLFLSPEKEEEIERTHVGSRSYKEPQNEREDLVREFKLPGVLRVLSSSARQLLDKNTDVNKVLIAAAIQGFRRTSRGTTIKSLDHLFPQGNPALPPGKKLRHAFAKRVPNVIVMLDEVTGDGAGAPFVHEIATWMERQFIQPFENEAGGSPFVCTLIVSDASLSNEVVLDRFLNSGERAPNKVLVSASQGDSHFRLAIAPVRIANRAREALHVMANSYPARKLSMEYQVALTPVQPEMLPDGRMQTLRQAVAKQTSEDALNRAKREIGKALAEGAPQVIYFAQDKRYLRDLRHALIEEKDLGLGPDDVRNLDSSVLSARKKELVRPEVRDRIKVFLMTSSGSRGVSFPRCTAIIAEVPRFEIENALMELAQLIYRGRGSYKDELTGAEQDGDRLERKLVVLLSDYLLMEDVKDLRYWLRRASDLLTMLVMIRATILTRITGDSGLARQRLAVVPVGSIGATEHISLMAQRLDTFLKEAELYRREHRNSDLTGLVTRAIEDVTKAFSDFTLNGIPQREGVYSFAMRDLLDRLTIAVTDELQPLLPDAADERLAIPPNIWCAGPFWIESWVDFKKTERLVFEEWNAAIVSVLPSLMGRLRAISMETQLPSRLRRPADELLRYLARDQTQRIREFATIKALDNDNTWVALPLDYTRFLPPADPENGLRRTLREHLAWRDALGHVISPNPTLVMPVLTPYERFPWAATVTEDDPTRFSLVLDDRYFMASTELNLLNTLLLEDYDVAGTQQRTREPHAVVGND